VTDRSSVADRYQVAFDATPLSTPADSVTGHTLRGIGRYIDGLLAALADGRPDWASAHLRPVVTASQRTPPAGQPLVTRRVGWRRQDLGWWTAWLNDRRAVRGQPLALWHGLDPNMPLSPLPAGQTVLTCYDLIALHEPAAMAQIRVHRRAVYRLYLRRLRAARLVIAISHVTARDARIELGLPAERIRVVYPSVSPPTVPSRGDGALAGDEQPASDGSSAMPDMLFVGVPEPTKQPELAIEALAECRHRGHDVRLAFVGYHRPSDRQRLAELATARGVDREVDYHDRVDDERLAALYRSSVLLAVSRIEGFGLPPVEALLAGGRVVAGSAPAYREVLGDEAEYAATLDGRGLADAYEAALGRPAGRPPAALVERYSPRSTAAALIAAYEDALG
jgi:glycosyltransferase involved in cell wall biosynthesis